MLESGEFATIAELAEREGIIPFYMTRVLRLTRLALDIIERILDGERGPAVTLAHMLKTIPGRLVVPVRFPHVIASFRFVSARSAPVRLTIGTLAALRIAPSRDEARWQRSWLAYLIFSSTRYGGAFMIPTDKKGRTRIQPKLSLFG